MRILALSDLHVDYRSNLSYVQRISDSDFRFDVLILAGDISDDVDNLKVVFTDLRRKFAHVFFVPGNHELWIRRGGCVNSIEKFWHVLELCGELGVKTSPYKVGNLEGDGVWIVPLFSWYVKPEEGSCSLFVPKNDEDPTLAGWGDNRFTRWPPVDSGTNIADYFLHINEKEVQKHYDALVISFSHFVPRRDLIFRTGLERQTSEIQCRDRHPTFNFSRVAGCSCLEEQIRQLGSAIHVYGHQHRNRHRIVDGVLYASHCLGYSYEREFVNSCAAGVLKLIWDTSGKSGVFTRLSDQHVLE